ncbi:MAG: hypothetical protein ABI895_19685 [Deltaproteobacteria bacterium]
MNILSKIGVVGMLAGMGTMVYGVSQASVFCLAPNRVEPPYLAIPTKNETASISCTTAAPAATGIGTGTHSTGRPNRICANLQPGPNARRASVNGYDAAGNLLSGCVKHDSTADNTAACVDCATAAQFQLTVFNF